MLIQSAGKKKVSCFLVTTILLQSVYSITFHVSTIMLSNGVSGKGTKLKGLLIPFGLVHPHIHLDKCYLLDKTPVENGTFEEAMKKTSEAKEKFDEKDLLNRGRKLIKNSLHFGVLSMRCHVEIDPTVGHKCLLVGEKLKKEFQNQCEIQLVAFAQDPILHPKDEKRQEKMVQLIIEACQNVHIRAIGSAPYVESSMEENEEDSEDRQANYSAQCSNIRFIFDLAQKHDKDVDFHLDYNLEETSEPLIWFVLEEAHRLQWKRWITIGHATRLSLFKQAEWAQLQRLCQGLQVSFIGLPPSDLYMQARSISYAERPRATLPLLELVKRDIVVALGVNNVANLFTPQGDGDPMQLLPLVVAIWQSAKPEDIEQILGMISWKANQAIGMLNEKSMEEIEKKSEMVNEVELEVHSDHSVLINGKPCVDYLKSGTFTFLPNCQSAQQAVLSPNADRLAVKNGRVVAWRRVEEGIVSKEH